MKPDRVVYFNPGITKSRQRLYRFIRGLVSGSYSVSVTSCNERSSKYQRGYYWGYLVPTVGEKLKLTNQVADQVLRALLLTHIVEVNGDDISITLSTSDLTKAETESFYTRVRALAWNKWRINLLEPNKIE